MISSSQRPLPDNTQHSQQTDIHASTQHSQQTDIHASRWIRTQGLSRRTAADLRLRPHGRRDQQSRLLVLRKLVYAISGFLHEVGENCVILGCYAESSNFLLTFRDKLSVPSSRFKSQPVGIETSLSNYHCPLRNNPEDRSSTKLIVWKEVGKWWQIQIVEDIKWDCRGLFEGIIQYYAFENQKNFTWEIS